MLTLSLAAAVLCSAIQCWPVLIGKDTPLGEFELTQRLTDDKGYGGDVLQFHEDEENVYAIHRVWTLRPAERRRERLRSNKASDRWITKGCINVDPAVYEYLLLNHNGDKIVITK